MILLTCMQLFSDTILVTNTNNDFSDGSLGAALIAAGDRTIIDCSPIAGQTIFVGPPLPAIGYNLSSPNSSLTILGSGVTIDGGNSHPIFSLGYGSALITGFTLQNGLSEGGHGGAGKTGGGGGTGGGGALYVHSGTTLTISAIALNDNQAAGGNGGGGGASGGSGGGGGGFGGGSGGSAIRTGANAGSAGGGGGNGGGTTGGTDGGAGSPNSFQNFAGAGGGGEIPTRAGAGGSTASIPAREGGAAGAGSGGNGGGGGGGAGSGGSGGAGSDASSSEGGEGGAGGIGFGVNNTYGAGGGGGGGGNGVVAGGAGYGTSGGGGGLNGPGGAGGALGGGGGASGDSMGGGGGFGAGGGGGYVGGIDIYGLGGSGGSAMNAETGGGGGSGLGGAIFVQRGALLIIEDGVTFSGNGTSAGTGGAAGGDGASLGQELFIQSGASATFQIDGTLTLPHAIEGAGFLSEVTGPGVVKSGAGAVHLTGANTYLGGTVIRSGTLSLNGSVSGDVQIKPKATLSGNATVSGDIHNSGKLSPGNSSSEMFTTNLYLSPTSTYEIEVNSAGNSTTITAFGLAQLNGTLAITPDDLNFTAPVTYNILTANSGFTGKISSLTSSVPALMSLNDPPQTLQLTYFPLDPRLEAAHCFTTLSRVPGSDAAAVNNALLALSVPEITAAFEQMSPAQFSGPTEVQLLDAILVRSTYTKHLQEFCFSKNSSGFWIDGIAEWQSQKKSGKQFGYRDTTLGATIGFDYAIHNWLLGLAFSSTYDTFHLKNFASKTHLNGYYGGFYSYWNGDNFYMNAALLGAFNKCRTTRQLSFGTIDRRAHSNHNGSEFLTHWGFGYRICPSTVQWTPYIHLDYVLQHNSSYTETGAKSLDLHVHSKNAMLLQGEAGISMSATYSTCNGLFIPMLSLAYMNQTPLFNKNYRANFTSSPCVFTGKAKSYERNLFAPHLALTYKSCSDRINASIYYDAEVASRYWAQDVGFDLGFRF